MNRIGFMQGRMVDQVEGRIQKFPITKWKEEFRDPDNFPIIEWTIDDVMSNPLWSPEGRAKIGQYSRSYKLAVQSICADFFMDEPFYRLPDTIDEKTTLDKLTRFLFVCREGGLRQIPELKYIVIPLVDNASIESAEQEDKAVGIFKTLYANSHLVDAGVMILFESDFAPKGLLDFITKFDEDHFGINYDMGNSAALGHNPAEEIRTYGHRIKNVHVKDRVLNGGTIQFGEGAVNFELVFGELARAGYNGDYILQPARAVDRNHRGLLRAYRTKVEEYISVATAP